MSEEAKTAGTGVCMIGVEELERCRESAAFTSSQSFTNMMNDFHDRRNLYSANIKNAAFNLCIGQKPLDKNAVIRKMLKYSKMLENINNELKTIKSIFCNIFDEYTTVINDNTLSTDHLPEILYNHRTCQFTIKG